jgi:hypothetical protein
MTHAFCTLLILRAALAVPTIILCNSGYSIVVEYLILLKYKKSCFLPGNVKEKKKMRDGSTACIPIYLGVPGPEKQKDNHSFPFRIPTRLADMLSNSYHFLSSWNELIMCRIL